MSSRLRVLVVITTIFLAVGCSTAAKRPRYAGAVARSCAPFEKEIRACAVRSKHKRLSGLLARIARCETGNKCTGQIDSPNGLYHGPFQYATGTWDSVCRPIFE